MSKSEELFVAAMQLPEGERLELALRLMDSVPNACGVTFDDANLLPELDRRYADDDGTMR